MDLYEAMKTGNPKQQTAYKAITELKVMVDLKEYKPALCGTIPIGIDLKDSDLDIIMDVDDLDRFEKRLINLYQNKNNFTIKRKTIRGKEVIKANFNYRNFEFELFGQSEAIHKQHAHLHMIIEHELLRMNADLKNEVICLKRQGYKTEPAFCKLLGINGDPYIGLIQYGLERLNLEMLK